MNLLRRVGYRMLPSFVIERLRAWRLARLFRQPIVTIEPDAAALPLLISRGNTVLDVGANAGLYTRYLSELVGAEGRVFSFEPIPPTYQILKRNITSSKLINVELINAAVSSKIGHAVMEIPRFDTGGESLYDAYIAASVPPDSSLRTFRVETLTLDSRFAAYPHRITFIKCDIEGHELECVRGAKTLIARDHPVWLIEITGDPDSAGSQAAQTFQFMREAGYIDAIYETGQLRKRRPGEKHLNYFFVTTL